MCYRLVAIVSLSTSRFFKSASMKAEISLLLLSVISIMMDLLLKYFRRASVMRGFFVYVGVTIGSIAAGFYIHGAPYFGIR